METANLTWGAVASNVGGVSGRRLRRAVAAGQSTPTVLAELAKGRLREQLPAVRLALAGRVHPQHRQLIGDRLDHLDDLEQRIQRRETRMADLVAAGAEQEPAVDLLLPVPATGPIAAAAILAEIGTDRARFPRAAHLASWAGVCPGNHRSAGKQRSGATTTGPPQLKTILCELAATSARCPGT